jgi:hypothetical protein
MFDALALGGGLAAALLLAVVVLVVCVLVAAGRAAARARRYLVGHWVGCPEFLKASGLTDMQLQIAPADDSDEDGAGYVLVKDVGGGVLANGPVTVAVAEAPGLFAGLGAALSGAPRHTFALRFTPQLLGADVPAEVTAVVAPDDGTLTLRDGSKVYAHMEKDFAASAAARKVSDSRPDAVAI